MTVDIATPPVPSTWDLLTNAGFTIGATDKLDDLRSSYRAAPDSEERKRKLDTAWHRFLAQVHTQVGTLLKADAVSLLLGAGASESCGGVLIGSVPLEVERTLLDQGISDESPPVVKGWLLYFYHAVARANPKLKGVPARAEEVIVRRDTVTEGMAEPLSVNYEELLSWLWRWRAALASDDGKLRLDGTRVVELEANALDECLRHAVRALAGCCELPISERVDGLRTFQDLLRKILTRPLNLKRANIFTLNYDTLVEKAADAEGVVIIDGFVGTLRRVFRPERYDQDLYFPAQTTEGRVHRLDRVAHLYKLHGSITWCGTDPDWDNPYGVTISPEKVGEEDTMLIYPTPAKIGDTLGMPYAELFRRFASCVVRPQSTLIAVGYGFGDDHVNAIVRQALAVPSFRLIVVDPTPTSVFVKTLQKRDDRRVWIFSGKTFGTFDGFVKHGLPDLRDEDVRREIMETYKALDLRNDEAAKPDDVRDHDE